MSDIKQHISIAERTKWDKNVVDFNNHLGAGGTSNHPLGNGSVAGFSLNDYTTAEKNKLNGIEDGANLYLHPSTHPASMITGLATVATTGNYEDLLNKPTMMMANGTGDAATVSGGIRITIGGAAPGNPVHAKELWLDTTNLLVKIYANNSWHSFRAVYA